MKGFGVSKIIGVGVEEISQSYGTAIRSAVPNCRIPVLNLSTSLWDSHERDNVTF